MPKWNFAHLAWSKQAKNIRKTPKNSWFTAPCSRTRQPGHPVVSLRRQVLARYPGFVRKLLHSRSREVQFLSNFVINDARSVTCRNISYLNNQTGLNVLREAKWKVRAALPHQSSVPVEEWRCSLLSTFLEIRSSKTHSLYNTTESQINQMIDSLCNS